MKRAKNFPKQIARHVIASVFAILAGVRCDVLAAGGDPVPTPDAIHSGSGNANALTPPAEMLARQAPANPRPNPPAVPVFSPPSGKVAFTSDPSDREIILARCFEVSLVPLPGEPQKHENSDLAKALIRFTEDRKGPGPLVEFLGLHPDSRWRPALLLNIGLVFESEGMWSRTIPAWEESWFLTKDFPSSRLKAIADRSLGEMAFMHGRLGHFERLQDLFAEIKGRDVRGPGAEYVREAKAGLWLMQNRPDEAFRCGPMALSRLYGALEPGKPIPSELVDFKSTEKGTTLAEIKAFADKIGLPCQIAYRNKGASVLVPCIVNWKVQHYAAITAGLQGGYITQDLTFGKDCLVSVDTLDWEASGYFMVRSGPLPTGWRSVSVEEGARVYGRGNTGPASGPGAGSCKNVTSGGDDNGGQLSGPPGPAAAGGDPSGDSGGGLGIGGGGHGMHCGMTTYSFDTAIISLMLKDTPVSYTPPVGQPVGITATYNQRDLTDRSNVGNLGDNWSFQLFTYIQGSIVGSTATATCFGPGNGAISYTGYTATSSTAGYFAPEFMSQDVLAVTQTTILGIVTYSFVLTHRDGSKEIYDVNDSSTPARVFRSASIDRYGNSTMFTYDSNFRMQTVTDSIHQSTVFAYGLSSDPTSPEFYLITKVTDPFGRYASFQYNSTGQLIGITDALGIQSTYTYGPGDFVTALTTPYGTTAFTGSDLLSSGVVYDRWLEATDPLGASEKIEWVKDITTLTTPSLPFQDVNTSGAVATNVLPTGLSGGWRNTNLNNRNTFYWNKKAMEAAPNDYGSAEIFHFCHDPADPSGATMGTVLESHKRPLENREWLGYAGQPNATSPGTTDQPSIIARILDSTTTPSIEQDFQYTYNALDNITSITDPLGRQTNFVYDSNLIDVLTVKQTDAASVGGYDVVASYTYDSHHQPMTYTDACGEVTHYAYNSLEELHTVTDPLTRVTTLDYDSNGYLQTITGPVTGAVTTLTHDLFGRVNTITDSDGYEVTMGYDAADRVVSVTYPDGTYNQVIYDKLDAEWTRDRLGRWSLTLFDPLRRMVLQRDPLLRETIYKRCPCGALIGMIDASGNETKWTLDNQSRITAKTYQDASVTTYTYETSTSRVKSVLDANGQTKTFSFNRDNTVHQVVYTNPIDPTISTATVGFTYDSVFPRITAMTDGTGTTNYTYNPITSTATLGAGRLWKIDGPISSSTVSYAYDELGRVLSESVNGSANPVGVTYDSLGRVSQVTNPLGTFTPSYVNQTNRLSSLAYPNSQLTNFSYYPNSSGGSSGNGDDRLETIANLKPSTANLSTFGYTYDSNGEIQSWSTQLDAASAQTASFHYDAAQQLTIASMPTTIGNPAKAYSYTYDLAGNRLQEQIDNSVTASSINNLNQLTAQGPGGTMTFTGTVSAPGTVTVGGNAGSVDASGNWTASSSVSVGSNSLPLVATDLNGNVANKTITVTAVGGASRTLMYDANGNLTNNGAGQTYAWDQENRLVKITQTSGTTGFVYNGLGQRVQEKLSTSVIKQWVWGSGPQPLEERNSSGAVTKRFYGSLGEQIGGTNYYFTTDNLGSVREMADSSGVTQARYSYDPFGRRTLASGTDIADFGYTGDYYHVATGLSLTQFREYDPNLGRWLSRDPIGLTAGTNLYSYVENNPISRVDPSGLWQFTISGGDIFGGAITFGNNGGSGQFDGQWNLGVYVGIVGGDSFNIDPNNSGCRATGYTDPSLRVESLIAYGWNVSGKIDIRDLSDLSQSDAELAFNPSGIPGLSAPVIEQKNGQISIAHKLPSWGWGDSVYAGLGETKYGENPSKCSCSGSH